MAVPWSGFPLAALVELARPLGSANYLQMTKFEDPEMAPGQADLHHPEIGPHLHRYVVGKDNGGANYFRLLKLAWEYACDAFGSRQLLFEMYNVSSLATNKQRLASAYDTTPFVALAKELAGITGQVERGERASVAGV